MINDRMYEQTVRRLEQQMQSIPYASIAGILDRVNMREGSAPAASALGLDSLPHMFAALTGEVTALRSELTVVRTEQKSSARWSRQRDIVQIVLGILTILATLLLAILVAYGPLLPPPR